MGIVKLFKSVDIYGHPVGVNYRGDDAYKTKFGAIWSIYTFVTVMLYAITKL